MFPIRFCMFLNSLQNRNINPAAITSRHCGHCRHCGHSLQPPLRSFMAGPVPFRPPLLAGPVPIRPIPAGPAPISRTPVGPSRTLPTAAAACMIEVYLHRHHVRPHSCCSSYCCRSFCPMCPFVICSPGFIHWISFFALFLFLFASGE